MTLLFIFAGVYGIILSFKNITYISYNSILIFLLDAAFCIGLGLLLQFFRKKIILISSAIFGGLILLFFIFYFMTDMGTVLRYFTENSFASVSTNQTDVTSLALYISFWLIWIFYILEILAHNHIIPFLTILTWTLCSPLLGIEISINAMICMILFQMVFFVVNMTNTGSPKNYFSVSMHPALLRQSAFTIVIYFLVAFVAAFLSVNNHIDTLYTSVDTAENSVYQILNSLTGKKNGTIDNGKINSGNLYQTGTPEIELQLNTAPKETLYLYAFRGGDYIGNEWETNHDYSLMLSISDRQNISLELINNYYYIKKFLNTYDINAPEENTFTVSVLTDLNYNLTDLDTYYSKPLSKIGLFHGYEWNFYSRCDYELDYSLFRSDSGYHDDILSFRKSQNSYMQMIQSVYTQYPEEKLPRLNALCTDMSLSDVDEVTAYIVYILSNYASYTTTPGTANRNQDIIEYFLFENHKGYCVHYASAATLIYRMYGIPARYVSGYAISESDFSPQPDGSYIATVSDKQAHAWTEIYLENYGWVPVEFTPSDAGVISATYPGFTDTDMMEIFNKYGWTLPTAVQSGSSTNTEDTTVDENTNHFQTAIVIALLCISIILLIAVILVCRRQKQIRRLQTLNVRCNFGRLIDALHFANLMKNYNGTEDDFIPKLCEAVPYLSDEDAERLVYILEKYAYSQDGISKKDAGFVKKLYQTVSQNIYTQLGTVHKLCFKYIKGYI